MILTQRFYLLGNLIDSCRASDQKGQSWSKSEILALRLLQPLWPLGVTSDPTTHLQVGGRHWLGRGLGDKHRICGWRSRLPERVALGLTTVGEAQIKGWCTRSACGKQDGAQRHLPRDFPIFLIWRGYDLPTSYWKKRLLEYLLSWLNGPQ